MKRCFTHEETDRKHGCELRQAVDKTTVKCHLMPVPASLTGPPSGLSAQQRALQVSTQRRPVRAAQG